MEQQGVHYFEVSSHTGDGVTEMMEEIFKQSYEYRVLPEKLKSAIEGEGLEESKD